MCTSIWFYASCSLSDVRRLCRCRRWLCLTRWGYHSVCCQCTSFSDENILLAPHAWLTLTHHNKPVSLGLPGVYMCARCRCRREWMTRSDIWPLKQLRINGFNRQTLPEGCELVMGTSTSHIASMYLPFRIHALLQPELPDVHPLVENRRQRTFYPKNKTKKKSFLPWSSPGGLSAENNIFQSRAHLVVWTAMVFRWSLAHWWWDSWQESGEVRDIRHCRDSNQGPEENEHG